MEYVLITLLGLAVLGLVHSRIQRRRLLIELEEAVRARKPFLAEQGAVRLRRYGVVGLIRETNALIEEWSMEIREKSGFSQQLEATFGALQAAIFILDERRVIVFSNEAARRYFENGKKLNEARIETILRSPSLLEYLDATRTRIGPQRREIAFERGGEMHWFEASCTNLEKLPLAQGRATLLVLHDITRLKRLEMMRRDFVANVSHELRTPLTIIKGFAETLAEENETLPVEARARFLGKITNNAQRLHLLVEDLMTLSRLESKPEQLSPAVQSLHALLSEICETYRTRLERPEKQRILLDFDRRVGDFAFDRFRINQVVDNLIENVFRYAPDFTELTVRVRYLDTRSMVECSVSDDGPGIPAKDLPHIFERFYRVDKGRSRVRGGTGLGLSISKHIVQLHGGEVRAESVEGKGTTMYFLLPYEQSCRAAGAI